MLRAIRYVGLGLIMLALALQLLSAVDPAIRGHQAEHYVERGQLAGAMGLALYAISRGRNAAWYFWAILPVFGTVIGLIGLTVLPSRWPTEPASGFLAQLRRYLSGHAGGLVGSVGVGVLAAIAIPNFQNYSARGVQSEARVNLGGIYVAEVAFYEKHKRYGTFKEIGFELTSKINRYTYRIDNSGKPGTVIPAGSGQATLDNAMIAAGFSPTGFTATAAGNIDDDSTIDQWHVNDAKQGMQLADVDDDKN